MLDNLIIPERLKAGDTVCTVSLSWGGAGDLPWRYQAGKKQIEETFGLNVIEAPNSQMGGEWLYNNPKARADDLMWAFKNPDVKAIISNIGGDDSIRLMPYIDYDVIRDNPKIFTGYSDSTITHFMCLKAGLRSYYGPSLLSGFAENAGMHNYLIQSVKKVLFSDDDIGVIPENKDGWTVEHLEWFDPENVNVARKLNDPIAWQFIQGAGQVTGRLLGGCTEVLDFMKGTDLWPDISIWNNSILFIENSEDMPSPSDTGYSLRNFGAMGGLERIKGVLFSRPGGHTMPIEKFKEYDDVILKILKEYGRTNIPVVTHMDFGHTDPMMVIPYGANATIDVDKKQVSINEAGCALRL